MLLSQIRCAALSWLKVASLLGLLVASAWPGVLSIAIPETGFNWGITELDIAPLISEDIAEHRYPRHIRFPGLDVQGPLSIRYTIDSALQSEADRLWQKYNPDYGIFVAIDPASGHILAMSDAMRAGTTSRNLSLVNTFPAASISKIITAVAAVNEHEAKAKTIIPFNGKTTSLYKKNIFQHEDNKWTKEYSLKESFAKSVNSVFGRLGAVTLGAEKMLEYAARLGFNGRFASDIQFANGVIEIDPEDAWQVAEMASGYTVRNTLSPLHAAALAATAINDGNLTAPVLVNSLSGPYGIPLYVHRRPAVSRAMSVETAGQLQQMMQATVTIGSAKKSFRGFFQGDLEDAVVGGKTGSLTGFNPRGKYDWFVGFGKHGNKKIAYAVLCINVEKWYVKSARYAREILEYYFHREDENTASLDATDDLAGTGI